MRNIRILTPGTMPISRKRDKSSEEPGMAVMIPSSPGCQEESEVSPGVAAGVEGRSVFLNRPMFIRSEELRWRKCFCYRTYGWYTEFLFGIPKRDQ